MSPDRLSPQVGAEYDSAVASTLLGSVHGGISVAKQVRWGFGAVSYGDAHAGRHHGGFGFEFHWSGQCGTDPLGGC